MMMRKSKTYTGLRLHKEHQQRTKRRNIIEINKQVQRRIPPTLSQLCCRLALTYITCRWSRRCLLLLLPPITTSSLLYRIEHFGKLGEQHCIHVYECLQCFATQSSASTMKTEAGKGNDKQRLIFRDIRRYYCEYCGICRSKKSLLRSHILSHHKEELQKEKLHEVSAFKAASRKVQHACEECGASFWKPAHLAQHMRSHSVERPFACPVKDCYFSYRRKDHLNRHLLKHQGTVFNCPVQCCNRAFSFQGNMKRHVKELHDDDSPREVKVEFLEIFCGEPLCMKPFTNSECLKAHIQSCHKYVKCEVCGALQLRKNFKRHQRTHEGVISKERINCSFQGCEQTFSKKSNLNKHVKAVHEKLRPFRCRTSGCQQRFSYKHVRDNHEMSHVYVQGNFFEADEQWRSRPRGGRKRERITIEALTRKRVVPLDRSSIMENGADYLRWLLADDE
ncbi:hypothetical protein IEQ34_002640 [Dendrobium chrysotoxum]|uniref:C2H2-type domain-containing protein n=1 Tax=Dendrobium chrysotoxum TaxID=161865 RepID=A0AAV7HFE8_DENCH|nr:hypothetical protein IEQ34_002640 [Dendrobium chrysotoxum]